MSFVKFAILATLGEMLGLRISTGVYHNKTSYYPTHGNLGGTGSITAIAAKRNNIFICSSSFICREVNSYLRRIVNSNILFLHHFVCFFSASTDKVTE